jgi:hypothetical protein
MDPAFAWAHQSHHVLNAAQADHSAAVDHYVGEAHSGQADHYVEEDHSAVEDHSGVEGHCAAVARTVAEEGHSAAEDHCVAVAHTVAGVGHSSAVVQPDVQAVRCAWEDRDVRAVHNAEVARNEVIRSVARSVLRVVEAFHLDRV